ncbi:carboxymuconolactone decarboxylase family protein [Streptomyces sp. NPDC001978]|uniref:carboxymuconolactone decarboxylase family protein n=1 Tax=Streptomyces sp. NPDC001978 TaxID=3364627 RepID=UPI0036B2BBF4
MGYPPELAAGCLAMFSELARGAVSRRDRKLATLSIAARLRSGYEWGHHAPSAATVDISSDEVQAIRTGARGILSDADQLVVDYAVAVEEHDVSDGLWARMSEVFDTEQLVQLTALAAMYGFNSRVQSALRVDQDTGLAADF